MTTTNKEQEIKDFIIIREFNAPRELVWKAWTNPEHLKQWMSPVGFTMVHSKFELRAGGENHYCLRSPDGNEMWGKWVFREIDPPNKLVLIQSFSDANGGLTRHPMAPVLPLETLATNTFEEKNGKTLLTLTWRPITATAEEITVYNTMHESMNQGWGGTFAKLDEYLAKIQKDNATKMFLNLPVKNLNKSIEFFTKLGYTFNPQFIIYGKSF